MAIKFEKEFKITKKKDESSVTYYKTTPESSDIETHIKNISAGRSGVADNGGDKPKKKKAK